MALNILVVDDSPIMRKMVIKTLRLAGLPIGEVHEAGNGEEGLEELEANWIDMAFIDINMPVMNGEEMIIELRKKPEWAEMPIVVVSTEGSQTRIERIQEQGAKFVHKPFSPEVVRKLIVEMTGVNIDVGENDGLIDMNDVEQKRGDDLAQILQNTAVSTFEALAFILTMPEEIADMGEAMPDGPKAITHVGFDGPCKGMLYLAVPQDMLPELASNMLGTEDMPSDGQQEDSLKELLNVVCGNLLPAVAGAEAVFNVSAPAQVESGEAPDEYNEKVPDATAAILLDCGQADLSLFMNV